MKKLNFAILGAFWAVSLATQAVADTTIPWTKEGCESVKGIWVTAHSATESGCDAAHCNGKNFCRSAIEMTWFSALIWCQSIGHKLASFNSLCPGLPTGPNNTSGACANVKGIDSNYWQWTNFPWETDSALVVNFGSGGITSHKRNRYNTNSPWHNRAACEE